MFQVFFGIAVLVTIVVSYIARRGNQDDKQSYPKDYVELRRKYLIVYICVVCADWLQGPYSYALYASYGFPQSAIAQLFVTGFASSMIFGTFIGSFADRLGRRKFCLLYCIFYFTACALVHFKSFWILWTGRVVSGVATSLLFSSFDAWLVSEHKSRKVEKYIGSTYSIATLMNSIVAILSGVMADNASNLIPLTQLSGPIMYGGFCSAFGLSAIVLVISFILICLLWDENYGEQQNKQSGSALGQAFTSIFSNPSILLVGLCTALFEGSMYTFVFMWTPTFSGRGYEPPYGLIFATFMVGCMLGSSLVALFDKAQVSKYSVATGLFLTSATALSTPIFFENSLALLTAFFVFEVCVGMYFPTFGAIKGGVVPQDITAAVLTLFRVPLNFIVLAVLLTDIPQSVAFGCCVSFQIIGVVLVTIANRLRQKPNQKKNN